MSERIIGDVIGSRDGPLVIVVGGLHGNEPAGVIAAERLLASLKGSTHHVSGRVLALRGNLAALAAGARFIDTDLNRVWGATVSPSCAEGRERDEIIEIINAHISDHQGPVFVCDLHTTSGSAPPFRWVITENDISFPLPVPTVFGTTGAVKGTFGEWMARRGATVVCVEGGQHDDPESAENHLRILYVVLGLTGCLPSEHEDVIRANRDLVRCGERAPRESTIIAHHQISSEDKFQMRPGFRSFEAVKAGQFIADDRNGPVAVPLTGYLLLPLYQSKGEDGFLVVREGR